jgi:hypothetical protein
MIRVRVEMMGSPKGGIAGKSQSVLVTIDPACSSPAPVCVRRRRSPCRRGRCARRWRGSTSTGWRAGAGSHLSILCYIVIRSEDEANRNVGESQPLTRFLSRNTEGKWALRQPQDPVHVARPDGPAGVPAGAPRVHAHRCRAPGQRRCGTSASQAAPRCPSERGWR